MNTGCLATENGFEEYVGVSSATASIKGEVYRRDENSRLADIRYERAPVNSVAGNVLIEDIYVVINDQPPRNYWENRKFAIAYSDISGRIFERAFESFPTQNYHTYMELLPNNGFYDLSRQSPNPGLLTEGLNTIVSGFLSYPQDWDGYDADRISRQAVVTTKILLSQLSSDVPPPHVAPLANGAISLLWETDQIYLEIVATSNGLVTFYADHPEIGDHEFPPNQIDIVIRNTIFLTYFNFLRELSN